MPIDLEKLPIDLEKHQIIPLRDARRFFPGRPHISTINRWHLRGVRSVKLETLLVGGRRYTSLECVRDFIRRVTLASSTTTSQQHDSSRTQGIVKAERALALEGFGTHDVEAVRQ